MSYIYILAILVLLVLLVIAIKLKFVNTKEILVNHIKLNESSKSAATIAQEVLRENLSLDYSVEKKINRIDVEKSYKSILKTYEIIKGSNKSINISGSQWLIDNIYIIHKEYKTLKQSLKKNKLKTLPVIKDGEFKNFPRVYYLAIEFVSGRLGYVDEDTIVEFIKEYQKENQLTMDEVWYFPIMLRVVLIKYIDKLAMDIKQQYDSVKSALEIYNKILKKEDIKGLLDSSSLSKECMVELLKILKDTGKDNEKVSLELKEIVKSIEINLVFSEINIYKKENLRNVLLGNSVVSLSEISKINYRHIFDKVSSVEKILCNDMFYKQMDFDSKDFYRKIIAEIAFKNDIRESYIATKAMECREYIKSKEYENHVGYYLLDNGRDKLNKVLNIKYTGFEKIKRFIKGRAVKSYLTTVAIFTIVNIITFMYIIPSRNIYMDLLAVALLIIPMSDMAIRSVNYIVMKLNKPYILPKLNLKTIPKNYATAVIIPTIINDNERAKELLKDIEKYYLLSKDENIYFVLLGDLRDANKLELEDDKEIVEFTLNETKKLNLKYCKGKKEQFFFLCRHRVFNEGENFFIGYERKRGKIIEFNRLIKSNEPTTFNVISSSLDNLKKIKYVITLDSDTQLSMNVAKNLIGTLAHPLNKGYIDYESNKVLRGYGVLQPRISISLNSSNKTIFSKLYSGECGIDIYTKAVSDIYQDLFKEGIFTGKGIYDIDIFYKILDSHIPENTVLSHDLLEGCYLRCGLVTNIELIDDYPKAYSSYTKRKHRWLRGDWQLISWLKSGDINFLSKWKIFDNLRRSLVSTCLILSLILATFKILSGSNAYWASLIILWSSTSFINNIVNFIQNIVTGNIIQEELITIRDGFFRAVLMITFLAYETYLNLDAIVRAKYRMLISHKNLLQWQTAADVDRNAKNSIWAYLKLMWQPIVIGSFILLSSLLLNEMNAVVLGICGLWIISPFIAYLISKPKKESDHKLNKENEVIIRKLARQIWAYFEDLINEKCNYIGVDNYQEAPNNKVAYRTSPTNIGMCIIANIVALDMGYININEAIERLKNTLESLHGLEKYNGHFFNWYNSENKKVLEPKYVSTVDSGNLVAYLYTTKEALKSNISIPLTKKIALGLEDNLELAIEEMKNIGSKQYTYVVIKDNLENTGTDLLRLNEVLLTLIENLESLLNEIEDVDMEKKYYWTIKLLNYCKRQENYLTFMFPFLNNLNLFSDMQIGLLASEFMNKPIMKYEKIVERIIDDIENPDAKMLLQNTLDKSRDIIQKINIINEKIDDLIEQTDFSFLYDSKKGLLSIGFSIESGSISENYYDLLASEARCAYFIAICKRDIPIESWFTLGRLLGGKISDKGLMSWSGTMFEYFMPRLIMKNYNKTLLDEAYRYCLRKQVEHGKKYNIPFGISESGFYCFDKELNYQYKAFGVQKLSFKNYDNDEIVISPYSSVLTLMEDEKISINNIKRIMEEKGVGRYGLYEAIDYTKSRIGLEKEKKTVKSYMIHHLGMSIMAIDNCLNDCILQKYFHNNAIINANEILLQEKRSKKIVYNEKYSKYNFINSKEDKKIERIPPRAIRNVIDYPPKVNIISNKDYSVMLLSTGAGYSKFQDRLVYRYREVLPENKSGVFFYIKDVKSKKYFSTTYEPIREEREKYNTCFYLDKAEFFRNDSELLVKTAAQLHKDENLEIRSLKIYNKTNEKKVIELTSYCEVTLQSYDSDLSHPAFGNLFIETEYLKEKNIILARRRARSKKEKEVYLAQSLILEGDNLESLEYETSREEFIGRGRTTKNPKILYSDEKLKGSIGAVIDPIISLRKTVEIKEKDSVEFYFVSTVGLDKERVTSLIAEYRDINRLRTLELSSKENIQEQLVNLNLTAIQANLYQDIATNILFLIKNSNNSFRNINKFTEKKSELWKYGISGDIPIILIEIFSEKDIYLLRQTLDCYKYLSYNKLNCDLVILNREQADYIMPLEETMNNLIRQKDLEDKKNKNSGIHFVSNITKEDCNLLKILSALYFNGSKGDLYNQINSVLEFISENDSIFLEEKEIKEQAKSKLFNITKNNLLKELECFNGYGGFSDNGRSYSIVLTKDNPTPMPWINVISNKEFGFIVSEIGSSYTWYKNSRENKITSWNNDYISDSSSENIYLCENGRIKNLTKCDDDKDEVIVTHGFGFSKFIKESMGIYTETTMFVPRADNVKVIKIKVSNTTNEEKTIKIAYYLDVVLGVARDKEYKTIVTDINELDGYITCENFYNEDFNGVKAYLAFSEKDTVFTGDKNEFIGLNGDYEKPVALKRCKFSGRFGRGLNPCMAGVTNIKLEPFEDKTTVILLCAEESKGILEIQKKINYYTNLENVELELNNIKTYWSEKLDFLQVKTDDRSFDLMVNGWLLYQSLSCRIWARTAFYQCGGAYGFRDQLQDVMATIYFDKDITREHILYAASYQFEEGDVMHWWHPYRECGIRTRFSDDLLWLPYVVCDYLERTGDKTILDEEVRYIKADVLNDGIDESYGKVKKSHRKDSIYNHCIRAIEKALRLGEHNLPLIGSGDWNDGMSTVGNLGKGESIWLAWFLCSVLDNFKELCNLKGDLNLYKKYAEALKDLKTAIEQYGWDGNWYRRAYFDDGKALGSSENDECRIDSISQSWAVISKSGDKERILEAMKNVYKYLVKKQDGIILLLTPPFDKSNLEPGYIKGYIPGVRENGGQYTHAAAWTVLAYAMLGEGEKAKELFTMINPVNHSKDYNSANKYKVEPYVICADIYSVPPHNGRGGWSYYTGSASWMYKVAVEGILGFRLREGIGFVIEPLKNIPFESYSINHQNGKCIYNVTVKCGEVSEIYLDGNLIEDNFIRYEEGQHNLVYIHGKYLED